MDAFFSILVLISPFCMGALDYIYNLLAKNDRKQKKLGITLIVTYIIISISLTFFLISTGNRDNADESAIIENTLPSITKFFTAPASVDKYYQIYVVLSYVLVLLLVRRKSHAEFWKFLLLALCTLINCWQIAVFPSSFWKIILFAVIILISWGLTFFCFRKLGYETDVYEDDEDDEDILRVIRYDYEIGSADCNLFMFLLAIFEIIVFILNCVPKTRLSSLNPNIRWLLFGLVMAGNKIFLSLPHSIGKQIFHLLVSIEIIVHLVFIELSWGIVNVIKATFWLMS